jgi:hypothetical protein
MFFIHVFAVVTTCPLSIATIRNPSLSRFETMPAAKVSASKILAEFEQAHIELVGKAVILADGKAGTIENVWLDELHCLRISVRDGKWPISTIKLVR